MKIAYITAGAAGMFCGSCLHDNTLVSALIAQGHDALLIPTYTPLRTDEENVSTARVFFGGINVFLQQKVPLFRKTPWFVDQLLDAPSLLRWAGRFAVKTQAQDLGALTVSMLQGELGHQRKENDKLVHWLATEVKPEIVNLTNVLLSGLARPLTERLGVPVVATLQGDDLFLEALPEKYRTEALLLIRQHCQGIAGFIATSRYYSDFMAEYLGIAQERIGVVYPGLNLKGHGGSVPPRDRATFTVGYLARICREKGLHVLVDAYRQFRHMAGAPPSQLRVCGWLGHNQRPYFDDVRGRVRHWGLDQEFEYVEAPDLPAKVRFLQSLDVLSVPTTYREPKGLYVLEALANGVPVVQPRHGAFPELLESTGGGLLVTPQDPQDLARALRRLSHDPDYRQTLGQKGKAAVQQRFTADRMARQTVEQYQQYLPKKSERKSAK